MHNNVFSINSCKLSIILPIYLEDSTKVASTLERLTSYKVMLQIYGGTELIIVNDGSIPELTDHLLQFSSALVSVINLPRAGDWTQARAKNIGLQAAVGERVLISDINHIVPPMALVGMLKMKLKDKQFVRFKRRELGTTQDTMGHTDIGLFLKAPKYFHEQFCGNYSFETKYWLEYHNFDEKESGYTLLIDNDTMTHNLSKDLEPNSELIDKLRRTREEPEVTSLDSVFGGAPTITRNFVHD